MICCVAHSCWQQNSYAELSRWLQLTIIFKWKHSCGDIWSRLHQHRLVYAVHHCSVGIIHPDGNHRTTAKLRTFISRVVSWKNATSIARAVTVFTLWKALLHMLLSCRFAFCPFCKQWDTMIFLWLRDRLNPSPRVSGKAFYLFFLDVAHISPLTKSNQRLHSRNEWTEAKTRNMSLSNLGHQKH